MPEDRDTAIRGIYGRWSKGDFRSTDFYDPHFLMVMGPGFPDAGLYTGLDQLARYTRGFLEPWKEVSVTVEEITVAGDSVVVAVRQRGLGEGSGITTELRYFQVWTFRGEKAIRMETFREETTAREAVGLPRDLP